MHLLILVASALNHGKQRQAVRYVKAGAGEQVDSGQQRQVVR